MFHRSTNNAQQVQSLAGNSRRGAFRVSLRWLDDNLDGVAKAGVMADLDEYK